MKYLEYRERRSHGTFDFPFAFYAVTPQHPRYNMVDHWHAECEIIRILDGKLLLTLDGKQYAGEKGDIFFVSEGVLHGGIPENCSYECLVFDLQTVMGETIVGRQNLAALLNGSVQVLNRLTPDIPRVAGTVDRLFRAMGAKNEGRQLLVLGSLYEFFGIIAENGCFERQSVTTAAGARRVSQFKNVLTLIKIRYHEALTLDEMAACTNMNKKYFCRYFKSMTQKTPVEYLNYYRIECACEQMINSDMKISEIALGCGFNDISYFIKVFKRYKGVSPLQYLNRRNS